MKYFDVSTNKIIYVKSKKKFTSGRFAVTYCVAVGNAAFGRRVEKNLYGNNYNA